MTRERDEEQSRPKKYANARKRSAKTVDVRSESSSTASEELPPELVVRLDSPQVNATILSDRVSLHGWLLANEAEATAIVSDPAAIEVLVGEDRERDQSLYSGMTFFGHNLREDHTAVGVKLENFELVEVDPLKYGPLTDRSRRPYDIRGSLVLRSIVAALGKSPRTFRVNLRIAIGSRVSISNPGVFTVVPRPTWLDARGGFSFPIARTVHSNFLIIEGWALKLNDALESVEIFFGEHSVGKARIGLPSPDEHASLPDPEESAHCRFSLVCSRKELTPAAVATDFFEESFSISARCRFHSGHEMVLAGPQFRWAAPLESASPHGEIETVRMAQEGLIEVRGWVVNPVSSPLRFFLEGRAFRIELAEGAQLKREPRPDITADFAPEDRLNRPGFVFHVHPEALGKFPGVPRVVVETADGASRAEIGPQEAWENIASRIQNALKLDAKEKLKAELSKKLCRRGFRKDFAPSPTAAPASQKLERILVASHNLAAVEGAPKVLSQIVRSIVDAGQDPSQLRVVTAHDGPLRKFYEGLGISVQVIAELGLFQQTWDRYQHGLAALEQLMGDFAPQLVLANVIDSFWAADYAARAEIPCFWLLHESVEPKAHFQDLEPQLRLAFLERIATPPDRGGPRLGFVAESTRALFAELRPHDEAIVIPNGVDLQAIEEQKKKLFRAAARTALDLRSQFVVTIVGTTTARKGQDTFLRAARRLMDIQRGTEFKFFVVGARDIPFLSELRRLADELRLKSRVIFVPETTDIAKYYISSDVMVVASHEESAPLVSLEAFAYERPLVSTAVYGLAEQVTHEVNALVFPPGDADALAAAIGRLVSDAELRDQLVRGGVETVRERFSLELANKRFQEELRNTFELSRARPRKEH
ncbi:MAG: glycosyltransferase family 4 protein [Bdellovibrionota bacterium]